MLAWAKRALVALVNPPRMGNLMSNSFFLNFRVCAPYDCSSVLKYIINLYGKKGPQCELHYRVINNCSDSAYILIWFIACSRAVLLGLNAVDNASDTRICIV